MAVLNNSYRLGVVASLKFLAIENMPPHFSTHVCYGQTAGWIRIPLGMEVRLGPDHTITWDPAPRSTQTATAAPTFWPAGPHFTHNLYCRLGNAWRAALVAILPDNCHPSSLHEIQCYVMAL